jgi:hypothetical protein
MGPMTEHMTSLPPFANHGSRIKNHCISNRKNRKPESLQLVQNKRSQSVLIATGDPIRVVIPSEHRERRMSLQKAHQSAELPCAGEGRQDKMGDTLTHATAQVRDESSGDKP